MGPNSWALQQNVPTEKAWAVEPFAIDGEHVQPVAWVGTKAGVLVYAPGGRCPTGVLTGRNLFGNYTGGKKYENGYLALAHKGYLDGDALKEVYVWVNKAQDAIAHPEELRPATEVFKRLNCNPTHAGGRDVWDPEGATLINGKKVGTWDWWPAVLEPSLGVKRQPASVLVSPAPFDTITGKAAEQPFPIVYVWYSPPTPDGVPVGGFLRFFRVGSQVWVATSGAGFASDRVMAVAPVIVQGTHLHWLVRGSINSVAADLEFGQDGTLTGTTDGTGVQDSYKVPMVAQPIPLNKAVNRPYIAIGSIPDSAFAAAVSTDNPSLVFLPVIAPNYEYGKPRTLFELFQSGSITGNP